MTALSSPHADRDEMAGRLDVLEAPAAGREIRQDAVVRGGRDVELDAMTGVNDDRAFARPEREELASERLAVGARHAAGMSDERHDRGRALGAPEPRRPGWRHGDQLDGLIGFHPLCGSASSDPIPELGIHHSSGNHSQLVDPLESSIRALRGAGARGHLLVGSTGP